MRSSYRLLTILYVLGLYLASISAAYAEKFLDIQTLETGSGIEIWLVEDHSLPIIAMNFAFKGAGSAQDAPEEQGLSLMTASTLDEGAGDYDAQLFQKMLSDHNIVLSFNADRDHFNGRLKMLTKHKDLAFSLLHTAITQPHFTDEALARIRASHSARIRSSLSDSQWITARLFNDVAFEAHPYALNSGGTLSTLQDITAAMIRAKVLPRFAKDNLVIAVTGDIHADELRHYIDDIFGALPQTPVLNDIADISVTNTGSITLYEQDIPQTIIRAVQDAISRDDPRYYAARVMNYILGGGGFGSRLMEHIREERGLTYGVYSSISNMDHIDFLTVSTSTKNENAGEVLFLITEEFETMRTAPVRRDELERAQSYLTGSLPLSLSSSDNISALMLSLQLAELPVDYLDHYSDKINAVTADDILSVAQDLLKEEALAIILVGKPENVTPDQIITELPNVR